MDGCAMYFGCDMARRWLGSNGDTSPWIHSMSVDISKALLVPGWTSEKELTWLAEQAQTHNRIVEIGSWKGRSTRALGDNTNGQVLAVDTWAGTKEDGHFKELEGKDPNWLFREWAINNADLSNVTPFGRRSVDVAFYLRCLDARRFDMIFIDAAHDYENVKADILAWRPLLTPGGLICGHDYDAGRPGVVKAVRELFTRIKAGPGSIWIGESWV